MKNLLDSSEKATYKFTIQGRLSSLNEYIRACRANVYVANDLKKSNEISVIQGARASRVPKVDKYPIRLKATFYEPNFKRDVDNVSFAVKFILDGLVKAQILKNDNQKHVSEVVSVVKVDKTNPRIEVEIERSNDV